jgi:lipid A 4'-phosphatase
MRGMMVWVALGILLALFFAAFPGLDLVLSGYAFDVDTSSFPGDKRFLVQVVYQGVKVVSATVVVVLSGFLWWRKKWGERPMPLLGRVAPPMKISLFLLLALLLGPGAAVHWGAKDFFARPRPRQVRDFGGEAAYLRPLAHNPSAEVRMRGYSFPSGHAAIGYYFTAFALVQRLRRRRVIIYSAGLGAGVLIGIVRILQGGHFLSDVLFSSVLVCFLNHLLYWLMFRAEMAKATPVAPAS